jgi:hypothetical protein
MGVPGGFLIDAKTKAVMPAPGLGDPWLPFRFALHSPNGQFLWSMADGRVVQFSTADGKIVKQLVLERVFATDPKIRTEIEQRQDIYRRTRLLGCTDTRLVLSVDNARLFVVDAGTGQWVECQEVPRGAPLRAFFRPGANELWVFADDRAIVYQVPE